MRLTVGSMFAGYGGIELALSSVLDVEPVWFAEFDAAPSRILAHHWPDVPNLGDVTKVDWASVPKVDVITGGSPCQDLSHAGKRKGMTDGTRSNLWVEMREAVAVIRPRLVVWENVRGALSAPADSDLEPCPGCVGDLDDGPVLRALGRVLGDLAELGYDVRWYGLRAADVGAAHGRFRVFLFAQPADADISGLEGLADQARAAQARLRGHSESGTGGPALAEGGAEFVGDLVGAVLPLVDADQGAEVGEGFGADGDGFHDSTVAPKISAHLASSTSRIDNEPLTLLPTPAVNDMGASYTPETWDAWTERMKSAHGNGNGHGKSLSIEALRLLPTPRVTQAGFANDGRGGRSLDVEARNGGQDWREYEAAIRRHEHALGRPAPEPTEPGAKGQPRLSPRFVEWLMMLPAGWVTDVPGISRNDQLKALGNGVVPAQCAAALRAFIHDTREAAA